MYTKHVKYMDNSKCVHVCVHMCVCACVWVHLCAFMCMHVSVCMRVCACMWVCVLVCVCVDVSVCMHVSVCMRECVYLCACVWMCIVCMCMHVCAARYIRVNFQTLEGKDQSGSNKRHIIVCNRLIQYCAYIPCVLCISTCYCRFMQMYIR
jgi:hypothetical protein